MGIPASELGSKQISRRRVLKIVALTPLLIASLSSCKKSRFIRPPGLHDLGEVTALLYAKQHVADKAMLVFRDDRGWSCLSMRCSYDGCDLTFQDRDLFCSCCNSHFTHDGIPTKGSAREPLPWYQLEFKEGHLYADSGKVAQANYRFTLPEAERIVEQFQQSPAGQAEQTHPVPNILLGNGDRNDDDTNELQPLPDETISDMTDTKRNSGAGWR